MKLDPKNPVRITAARDYALAHAAGLVAIDEQVIESLNRPDGLKTLSGTLKCSPLKDSIDGAIAYFIVMNSLNYQFWDLDEEGAFKRYERDGLVGAMAMQKGIHEACVAKMESSPAWVLKPAMYVARGLRQALQNGGIESVLGAIPDPAKPGTPSRMAILEEVLQPLRLSMAVDYLHRRITLYRKLEWVDAQVLATLFPKAYADDYLKKAQLTLMFVASELTNSPATDMQPLTLNVTAAADYQLPKVLRSLGVLSYGQELAEKVDSEQLIEADSLAERGIRAATVLACDKLAEHFNATIEEVDFWLWLNRNKARDAKFHLTKTTHY